MPQIVHIVLTKDPVQQDKLRRKLAEYEGRLSGKEPQVDPDATYKFRILRELLEKGSIDVAAFAVTISEEFGWHHRSVFNNAAAVIAAYNENALDSLLRSSGLK